MWLLKKTFAVAPLLLLVGCSNKQTLFVSVPSSKTGIGFENKPLTKPLFNILYYLYYYNGGGVATGDVNNDGLPDVSFTANNQGGNKLYLNKGNLQFEDVTEKAGVAGLSDWCTGVTMADVNGDGNLDIYVSAVANSFNLQGHNELYINNGNGTFTEKSTEYGLNFSGLSTQAAFFDYDHDGDLDCYLLNHSKKPHANITDTAARKTIDPISGDRLYRNDLIRNGVRGQVKFIDVSAEAGIYQSSLGYGLGLAVADVNNDGWEDVYVGNDFHENDYYYVNNGNGTFTESGVKHFGHYSRFSMGNDVADYNNDGQLDVFTTDMLPPDEEILKTYGSDENADIYAVKLTRNGYQAQYSRNCLQRNNGDGRSFSDAGLISGLSATDWSWCPLFADFDNDGAKDLLVTSGIVKRPVDLDYIRFVSDMQLKGLDKSDKMDREVIDKMPDGSSHPFLFKGNGATAFKDVSDEWGTGDMSGYFNGAAYADLDNDGDLDLVMNRINDKAVLLRNNSAKGAHLSISFKGSDANRTGIGTKAYVFSGGGSQYQQLMLTRGFESSSDHRLHFGLGTAATVDSVLVVWPDQRYQVIKSVTANKPLVAEQKASAGSFRYTAFFSAKPALFTEVTTSSWLHREDDFLDYNSQYLIPHSQSTRGPKLAVADANGDELDDYYACGAAGQTGALMLQKSDGSFAPSDSTVFNADKDFEDVDALFFDANGDGALDLYVASGGNKYADGSALLQDRLYLNNGRGSFSKAVDALPVVTKNKSCVTAADIDRDGDNDLFVGTLADAKAYGVAQTSTLLLNDGRGKFSVAPSNVANLTNVGMVTSASFADLNGDGWIDLAMVGEWMPVKVYFNTKGRFTESAVAASTGLWQSVYAADVDGDGDKDFLAGNWGHNTKLHAGKNGPCKLYVKDFDKNGSTDQILCYTVDGKEYPFLVKDELERSLPVLKKHYLTYGEVAGKTVDYIFNDLFKDYTELQAEVLASSAFINDGAGNFTRVDLPAEVQLAPVMAFASVNGEARPLFMAAGNFWGTIPYEGRYDALPPTLFGYDAASKKFRVASSLNVPAGEVRDVKWLRLAGGKRLLALAQNNDRIRFFAPATQ